MTIATLAVVLCFAMIHLFGGMLLALATTPRSGWLSAAGGVAVAYVFLHIFPELATSQQHVLDAAPPALLFIETHVWMIALLGLAVFYGLECLARTTGRQDQADDVDPDADPWVFRLHIASFAGYNALIGYLTAQRAGPAAIDLWLFLIAIGLHLFTNDVALRQHHAYAYDHMARWLLAGAVLAGWCLGLVVRLPEHVLAVPFAFLAGGIILNVLKEELPEERQSRFSAFAAGVAVYTAILLVASP